MTKGTWIEISPREISVLLQALSSLRKSGHVKATEVDALTAKLVYSEPYPTITVGVHGGQVQWVLGNPFPIRVCDYDGADDDLPEVDERGQRCRIWFEPVEKKSPHSLVRKR